MKIAIDTAGRIVVPKALRDELGLTPGTELEIAATDGRIEITPLPTTMRLHRRRGVPVAVPEAPLPPLTANLVRDTLEGVRR
jgi:AbrB family looped-hinge helix DNA binding protein